VRTQVRQEVKRKAISQELEQAQQLQQRVLVPETVASPYFTIEAEYRPAQISPTDSLVPKRNDRQKIELNVEILEGHLGCMKSTHSMNAATWGR